MEEIRNQADSGGSTTAGRNGASRVARLCSGVASGRASTCSRQRSPAPTAGAKSHPACPYQAFHRQHTTTVTAWLKPCGQHCLGETRLSKNIFRALAREGGEQGPGRRPPAFAFRKLFLSIASLATVSAPASAPASFTVALPQEASSLFLLLCVGIQHWPGSPTPNHLHPERQAHFV